MKSIVSSYWALLLTMVGIASFLLTPDKDATPYRLILEELEAASNIDRLMCEFICEYSTYYDQQVSGAVDRLKESLSTAGYNTSEWNARPSESIPFYVPPYPHLGTLQEKTEYLSERARWAPTSFALNGEEIRRIVEAMGPPDRPNIVIRDVVLDFASCPPRLAFPFCEPCGRSVSWHPQMAEECDPTRSRKVFVNILSRDTPVVDPSLSTAVILDGKVSQGGASVTGFSFEGRTINSPLDWLQHHDVFEKVCEQRASLRVFFPESQKMWSVLRDKTLDEAILIVREAANTHSKMAKFAGYEFSSAAMMWAAPAATLLTLLFLLAHVTHICRVGGLPVDHASAGPRWVGAYESRLSESLTFLTIVVGPPVLNGLLAWKLQQSVAYWPLMCGVIVVLLGGAGWCTHLKVMELRSKVLNLR